MSALASDAGSNGVPRPPRAEPEASVRRESCALPSRLVRHYAARSCSLRRRLRVESRGSSTSRADRARTRSDAAEAPLSILLSAPKRARDPARSLVRACATRPRARRAGAAVLRSRRRASGIRSRDLIARRSSARDGFRRVAGVAYYLTSCAARRRASNAAVPTSRRGRSALHVPLVESRVFYGVPTVTSSRLVLGLGVVARGRLPRRVARALTILP